MKKKWKIIIGSIVVLGILGFFVFELTKGIEPNLLEVNRRSVSLTFNEEGRVIPKTEQPIYPLNLGEIVEVKVKDGDKVNKGDLLVKINSRELEYQLRKLEGQLKSAYGEKEPVESKVKSQELLIEQARRDLETTKTNYDRISKLYEEGAATKQDYEDALNLLNDSITNLEIQKASPVVSARQIFEGTIDSLKAQIDLLKYQIEKTKVESPIDGIVSELTAKKGDIASPNIPLLNIFKKGDYEIEVYVLTDDVVNVKRGMEVKLTKERRDKDRLFEGTVTRVAPSAIDKLSPLGLEEQRVRVIIQPFLPENINIFPGYKLDVEFTTDKREDEIVLPQTAIFPYKGGEAIWTVKEGRAKVQPIVTGFQNERESVIEEGLTEGDLVILNPQLEGLKEGVRIRQN